MYFLMFMFAFHGYLAKTFFKKIFASSGSIPEIPFSRSCDFLFCLKGGDGKSLN
nr:MAG TPA: hypothetical protein [Caudoviricetes sp.]